MPTKDVMVIAGQAGSKSTFGAGLLRHIQAMDSLSVIWEVKGNEKDFEEGVLRRMWTQGKYPEQTYSGYVVTYTIGTGSSLIPTSQFRLVDLPGEEQRALLDEKNLMTKIRNGETPDSKTVESDYEQNIRPDFERGQSPHTTGDWETVFLYNYYTADDAIFLMNLHKVIYGNSQLAYNVEAVMTAVERFTDVAVIPTAVDVIDYDPDESYQLGWVDRVVRSVTSPQIIDPKLHETLNDVIDLGEAPHLVNILDYIEQEEEVDFFSVSVPGEDIQTGNLVEDPDDPGNFTVKGFDKVIEWL